MISTLAPTVSTHQRRNRYGGVSVLPVELSETEIFKRVAESTDDPILFPPATRFPLHILLDHSTIIPLYQQVDVHWQTGQDGARE